MIKKTEILIKKQLQENIEILDTALLTFKYSIKVCTEIGIKHDYSFEELDKFESLTSRFARISDIITQKVFKSIFILLREETKTFIDKINFAEKIGLIKSMEELLIIRDLRNEIAHEYCLSDISDVFGNVLKYSITLIQIVEDIKKYNKQNFGID